MTRYEHAQIGYTTIWAMVVGAVLVAIPAISAPSPGREALLVVVVVLLLVLSVFYKLTIKIDSETLQACFGTGLVCKKVSLAEIVAAEPIRIPWWSGWGIRLTATPYGWGWLYNVSGWDAVAVRLRDGRRFALGTDDPQGLCAALRKFGYLS